MKIGTKAIWLAVGALIGMALAAPPFAAQAAKMSLKPTVIKIEDALSKGLTQKVGGFNFSVLAEGKTGGVELFSLTSVKKHYHPMENHFLYIVKGRAKGQIGTVTAEVGPGDLVVIPAGKDYAHKLDATGSEPVVFLLFSSPPFNPNDIVWVEK